MSRPQLANVRPLEVYGVMGAERDGLILSTRQARQLGGGTPSAMCCDPVHRVRTSVSLWAIRCAAAGADSLFVPGLVDPAAIAELAAGPLPVAVMVWPGAPSVAELAAAGAVRISLGSAIAQAAYAVAVPAATDLLTSGTYDSVADGIAYNTMNDAVTAAPGPPG